MINLDSILNLGDIQAVATEDYKALSQDALDKAIEAAQAKGFTVFQSKPNSLLLDLDTPQSVAQYDRVFPILEEHLGATEMTRWASKSGHLHVMVYLPAELPAATRFALQAALGSDGKREALGIIQLLNGVKEPSVLFKPKQ